MKKIIALLLVAVMSLSLVACGGGSENNSNQQTNNGSQQETNVSQSGDANEPQKIELTLDNWSQCFDIVGAIGTSVYPNGNKVSDYIYHLVPKDSNIIVDNSGEGIVVRISCNIAKRYFTIDETGAITLRDTEYSEPFTYTCDSTKIDTDFSESSPCVLICGANAIDANTKYREEFENAERLVMFVPTDIEVLEIHGTVLLK